MQQVVPFHRKRICLLLWLGILAALLVPSSAFAQSGKQVVVRQRDADITILPNGDLQCVETWVVDFQRGSFTFAFREFSTDRLNEITDWTVTEGATPLTTATTASAKTIRFTWHFEPTNRGVNFFSELHTFILHYTVRGAMRVYPAGDQLWWTFVERDRDYPIKSATVRVHLPANFATGTLKTTTYLDGAERGGGRILEGQTLEFTGGPFPPQSEWEVRAQFPHVLTAAPPEWQLRQDEQERMVAQNNVYALVVGISLLVGGPLVLFILWYLLGRDTPVPMPAEFLNAPPDTTPPGVVGTLLDERADLQDIIATVADLARRGYLRIHESDPFGTPDYERTDKSDADLAPFERATLDALLRGMPLRRLEDVRGSFYFYLGELQDALYREVVARGYFRDNPLATRDWYFRIGKLGALVFPFIGLCAALFAFRLAPLVVLPLLALELIFFELLGFSRAMPRRTEQGAAAAAKWTAFKRYLASIEKYTSLSAARDQFDRYLPYAIAFGLEQGWIDKFKQTTAPAPAWYVPFSGSERGSAEPNSDNWSWREVGQTRSSGAPSTSSGGSLFDYHNQLPNSNAPIFSDPPSDSRASVPSLDKMADSSFFALNQASDNFFQFLNRSAEAFTSKPAERSATDKVMDTVGGILNWLVSSSGSSYSSSRSSSSSSSSSGGWSGGGSSGGGGSGGGSSGFG